MNFPKGSRRKCPVEGCPGVSETRAAMRVHFVHRHVHDTVVLLEEGDLPLPWCPPVRPAGLQEGDQWAPPGDQTMQNGSEKKTTETYGGGGRGSDGEGVPRLREEDAIGDGVLISWEITDKHGRRLASGG